MPAPEKADFPEPEACLPPGRFIDSDQEEVIAYAREKTAGCGEGGASDDVARAVALYYAVRDDITYNPYRDYLLEETFRASSCLGEGQGFCIAKAALLSACCRAIGIPARVGFADVRNHLASRRLRALMGTDIFCWHGYSEIYLADKWVKATPAFDLALCDKFNVLPLEFDGISDSVFHPFDRQDRKHMEYMADRGSFFDVPARTIMAAFQESYPGLYKTETADAKDAFHDEAAAEN